MGHPFKQWLMAATTREQEILCNEASTSRQYLYQLSVGKRNASAEMAGRITDAAERLRRLSKGRLPKITRGDLCQACADCPHMKRCASGIEE